jgi:hypothetical protein
VSGSWTAGSRVFFWKGLQGAGLLGSRRVSEPSEGFSVLYWCVALDEPFKCWYRVRSRTHMLDRLAGASRMGADIFLSAPIVSFLLELSSPLFNA